MYIITSKKEAFPYLLICHNRQQKENKPPFITHGSTRPPTQISKFQTLTTATKNLLNFMCTVTQKENGKQKKKGRLLGGGKNTELLDACTKSSMGLTKATGICLTSISSLLVISTKTQPFIQQRQAAEVGVSLGCLCLLTHLSGHLAGMPVPFDTSQWASR